MNFASIPDRAIDLITQNEKNTANKIQNINNLCKEDKYSIFFLDPPFADKEFIQNLKMCKDKKVFNKNHLIIIHREKNSNDYFEDFLNVKIVRQYGRSKIIFATFS